MDAGVPAAAGHSANGVQHAGSISSGAIRGCTVVAPHVAVVLSLALLEPLTLVRSDTIDILWGSDDVWCQEN